MKDDDFDVDALKINGKLPTNKRKGRPRTKEYFARIPHKRGLALYGISGAAWAVLIELDQQIFITHKNPVRLANKNLGAVGMSRSTKQRALRQLQEAGIVTIEQEGHGAAIVMHHWFPRRA
jgi:DNA-binding transcriptional ArsR family regulator